MPEKYAGADWIEASLKIELSPFGRKVADILGQAWRGIYHLDQGGTRLRSVDWTDDRYIRITIVGELATFDSQHLTELVVAAHDECVRVSVGACNMQRLQLNFSRRTARDGNMFSRHPTIEQAVAGWRERLTLEEPREKISEEDFKRLLEARCESCERKAVAAAWNPSSGERHPCCFGCDTGAELEDLFKKQKASEEALWLLKGVRRAVTDADKKARKREILKSYQDTLRVYRKNQSYTIWRARQEFNDHRERLQAKRDAALASLEKEAKLP